MKLNLGCGRTPLPGYVNVDSADLPGVDVVADLEQPLPFEDCSVDEILGIDLIEHIREPLALMAELWRVATPGAQCTFALPYGSSDDAWEDPTHRRPYFLGSWGYFSQPFYWRADYGYRADWSCEEIVLDMYDVGDGDRDRLFAEVMMMRNTVARQTVALLAVKPARAASRDLITTPSVGFRKFEGT
jgi:SAM-dependent methyltransferase